MVCSAISAHMQQKKLLYQPCPILLIFTWDAAVCEW